MLSIHNPQGFRSHVARSPLSAHIHLIEFALSITTCTLLVGCKLSPRVIDFDGYQITNFKGVDDPPLAL